MKVTETKIRIGDLADGYRDDGDGGVVGYGGILDIRPHYQREAVYDRSQQDLVIQSINDGRPIGVMYWSKSDDGYEILDGQQRTIAICEYIIGDNPFGEDFFDRDNPSASEQKILDYELTVHQCDGEFDEKMAWFRVVNIAGAPLKEQEIRNAVYAGRWVSDARRWFSKHDCFAYRDANDDGALLNGSCRRQDYLETAIKWQIGSTQDKAICNFMAKNAHRIKKAPDTVDPAKHLYDYFRAVMDWAKATFPTYRPIMKGIDWGSLYNDREKYGALDAVDLEKRIALLEDDPDVKPKGIYPYVLTGDAYHLHFRAFTTDQKSRAYRKQKGICPGWRGNPCPTPTHKFTAKEMQGDHIEPWSEGGPTNDDNCQMLCKKCNMRKSNK